MRKIIVCLFVVVIFLINCGNSINAQNNIFGDGNTIGVVADNTVKFYVSIGGNWLEGQRADFTLPSNYRHIFGNGNAIGVVADNTVKFYVSIGGNWLEGQRADFQL